MHELEKLVHDRLQEPPVGAQEAGVLSHHVHDVGRDDRFVVLAALLLAQAEKICRKQENKSTTGHRRFGTNQFVPVWTVLTAGQALYWAVELRDDRQNE